jgi:tight adherence protein B
MIENFFNEAQYYVFLVLGAASIFVALFLLFMNKYGEWERDIKVGVHDYAAEIYDYFDRMYMRQSMNRAYQIILGTTIFFGVVGLLIGLRFGLIGSLIAGSLLAFGAYRLPGIVIRFVYQKRLETFDLQLIDALNMMSNAIKSGLSFLQVVQLLEQELPNPAKQEFAMVIKENRIGVPLNEALMNMSKRVPSADLFMIVNSVVTLSQQGGDLSEAFETIAHTIRERQRVNEKIKTMVSAGVTQGFILSSLPFVMMGLLYFTQPDYIGLLFTTNLGLILLGLMLVFITMGALWIKKILTIEI